MNDPVNKEVLQAVIAAENVVLATHIHPDGDALGSMLGFASILKGLGKRVLCYLDEPVSEKFDFLSWDVRVTSNLEDISDFVRQSGDDILGACLDCGDFERLGKCGPVLKKIHPFLVIDHHQGNNGFGDISWIEPHRSSTGEMIYDLALQLGTGISKEAADCLYTAILTDTGSFQYDSTSMHTFEVASHLVALGVQPAVISSALYDNVSFARLQLTQQVLATLELFFEGQLAVIRVSRAMLQTTGTTFEDCEGLVNFPRSVHGVRVAAFLKEGDDGVVSVSLRAKGDCDVAATAAKFGGGGHRNAAGFRTSDKSLEQVRDRLISALAHCLTGDHG